MILSIPFIFEQFSLIVFTFLLTYLDYFISVDNRPFTVETTTENKLDNNNTANKPQLLIDTKITIQEPKPENKPIARRRHYSISSRPDINFFTNTPTLSPSTSSSTCSSIWNEERRLSKVEGMIQLFEMGGHKPQRRYSVDSHNYNRKQFIRERKFKFEPTADEWKKRANSNQNSPIQLTVSASTPVKRKMAPIPERSKSTWA
ncbi:hypothetical protein MFLAVUS_008220 [Mucor flavus]|uniref:Uncharacterized protein n=1 Tax=Mucor flavus TaxID=439312 RepID=A0ABP9Z6G7_9FUNG